MTSPVPAVTTRRLLLLRPDATMNGVDFASVRQGHPARLDVHFINRIRVRGTLTRSRVPVTLTSEEMLPELIVHPIDDSTAWSTDTMGRPVLHLTVDPPAVFARYTLTVRSDRLDPRFQQAVVSFGHPSVSCADYTGASAGAAPGGEPTVTINYLAKDFQSFCGALSDFSAARYPLWIERSEADIGVMLMEALSALADELSYQQDRVAAEATLDTATQPLSLLRHVRLVDYEPAQSMAAAAILQLDVAAKFRGTVWCQALDGQDQAVDFTVNPRIPGFATSGLDPRWNRYQDAAGSSPGLVPYWWDDSRRRLRQGATSMWISGHGHGFCQGQALLLDTAGAAGGDPPVREIVQVTDATEDTDPIGPHDVTLIRWATGLRHDHDLARTEIAGNLVPAVQGRITEEVFAIPGGTDAISVTIGQNAALAAARSSPAGSGTEYLYSLTGPLAWQPAPARDGGPPGQWPAISLSPLGTGSTGTGSTGDGDSGDGTEVAWQWVRRLLDADSTAPVFTITPERYSPVEAGADLSFYDYDGDGMTIRFGDGTFGRAPVPGTTFTARYLAGGGAAGNVAADTIVTVAPGQLDPPIWRCTNPFPATGGADAETAAQIRDRAPQQFRAGLLSLTGPADYEAAALSFSPGGAAAAWARHARAAFRWTGSWLSALTIVDPMTDESAVTQLRDLASLAELLDIRRLAGAESSVGIAQYLWLDLRVTVRAVPARRRPDIEAAVLGVLDPRPGGDGTTGFFGRDKWTFGQPLEASALATVIQSCPGVAGVTLIEYRRNVAAARWRPLPGTLRVDSDQILRIDNDRNRPDHGLLSVAAEVTP